jgi:hypothetical protein
MAKTNQVRRVSKLPEALFALRGNAHFEAFLAAMDSECGYGQTVFHADSDQSAFNQGRQSWANDVHKALTDLDKEAKGS